MNLNESVEKAKEEGIVHFWDLPGRNYTVLEADFKNTLLAKFLGIVGSTYKIKDLTGLGRTTICRYIRERQHKIRIDLLLRIIDVTNDKDFYLNRVEKNILWIGGQNSQGVARPKLPFNFNSREGARFLAAICNDGWISDGAYYSYNEQDLANSVKSDALSVFGGDEYTITEGCKGNDKYLAFPSVIRDCLSLITDFKGIKSETNSSVPEFIFKDQNLICGWIEQTIADEGHVKNYLKTNRREIVWRRSFKKGLEKYKLNMAEITMLDKIGIEYDRYEVGAYKTVKDVEKVTVQMRIARRENLMKLRKLIKIPCNRKEKIFTDLIQVYETRQKERLKVKEALRKLFEERGFVNSSELAKRMGYKNVNTAIKWLKEYTKQGLLKQTIKSHYCKGTSGPIAAKYALNI